MMTKETRRNQSISNAIYDYISERSDWFLDIKNRINIDISNSPSKRDEILLTWIKSCERVGSEVVKNEILKTFVNDNGRFNSQTEGISGEA